MSFKKFKRSAVAEMREVEAIEIDWFLNRGVMWFFEDEDKEQKNPLKISISDEDLAAGSPKLGDMIARNPDNHRDQWLVAAEYFKKNFEPIFVPEVGYGKDDSDRAYTPGIVDVNADDCRNMKTTISFTSTLKGDGFDFGHAIAAAKAGKKVARQGWNGQGMFAYIVPAAKYPAQTEIAKNTFGDMVPYRQYWALKTAQGDVATWAPSGSDSLAEDWMIVD